MLRKSRHAIEKILRNRGFTSPDSRRIMANQLMLAIAAFGIGVLAFPISIWPFGFALGTLLATANLWWMAKSVTWSVSQRFSPVLVLMYFGGFLLRFTGTGVLLYILLVRYSLPLVPLIAGLSSLVLCLMITAFSRNAGNSCKEA